MNRKMILILVAMLGLGLVGCDKKKSSSSSTAAATPYAPVAGPDVPSSIDGDGAVAPKNGDVVDWTPIYNQLDRFRAVAPVNDPRDFKLWVNLMYTGNGNGGNIQVQWKDSGQYAIRYFQSVNKSGDFPCNDCGQEYNSDIGTPPEKWNQWVTNHGKPVFHGIFEDPHGALVFMIEDGLDLGDGGGMTELTGTLWYKNFTTVRAPESYYIPCWFIKLGPFQCKDQISGMSPISTLDPGMGYLKLGTFHGLDRVKAFNETYTN
ncbi:MAG: hypothetical protein AB7O96_04340 [Pseudobdellovibrionaceae bacterium]